MRGPFHRGSARYLGLIAAAGLLASTAMSTGAATAAPLTAASSAKSQSAPAAYSAGRYIVTFADDPAASYDGSRKGFAATRPAAGKKLNTDSAAVKAWRGHLTAGHDAALAKVGATKLYDYTVTNNAVAVHLSAKQANGLAKTAGVVSLEKDQLRTPDTTESPAFLGLSAPGGLWSQLGGNKRAGAGTVVGIVDTGIWPESEAFKGGTGIPIPATWKGGKTSCQAGVNFGTSTCNDKLIGARYYVAGFDKHNIAKEEFLSPRDGSGHGSHTASTAAGNNGTNVTIDGKRIGTGSGMAPGAKIAAYKVCWEGKPGVNPGCFNSDSVAAINQAVADGVDVINYSIGGTSESNIFDSVEQAFRAASNAGVFVANSAGNSGPGTSTLDHPSPWLTTVAAGTFRRAFQAVELGNGARYVGASTTPPLTTPAPLVTAVSVKAASASDANAALCASGTLDPAKATGKVVFCNRGVVDRIEKGFEVKRVGGVGMVMANTSANSLNGDYHPVPAVHINHIDGAAVGAYITAAGAAATAKIVPLTAAELAAAPQVPEVTDFSSRGPSTTTGGDIMKPDITAPGNDVVAAVAPPSNHGRSWDFYSGTSMSSPHIAGIGALLKAAHPTWLPSEIKSALMTSASDTVSSASNPFAQGAGWVQPNSATNPGLTYPTTPNEYRSYMVSQGAVFNPPFDTLPAISGSDLNSASIAVGKLAGVKTVTRRVHNVSGSARTFTATATVPGFTVTVSPASLTIPANGEATFQVTLSRSTAPLGSWAIGKLTWTSGSYRVRSPITVRPVAISAPSEVHGDASATGSKTFSVTPGFTGSLTNTVAGLVGVTPEAGSVAAGPFDTAAPADDAATNKYSVVVPAGTKLARYSLDSDDNTADLDLFVYKDGELVALSASGAADEQVTMLNPSAGTYDVYVNGFATPGGATAYHQSNFVVGSASVGNGTVDPNPASVTSGTPTTLTAKWTGLDPAKRWLGLIEYSGATDVTVFSVG
jgi:subtilisin family serine protease